MPKNPTNQRNTITFTTVEEADRTCIESSPATLQFTKSVQREIFLTAPPQNSRTVTLTFNTQLASELFREHPASPLQLIPGMTARFVVKDSLGIQARPDFGNRNDANFRQFGRLFTLSFDRCFDPDGNDVHIEC